MCASYALPTNADVLLDTSAAVRLVTASEHDVSSLKERTRGLALGLAGHAQFETYSVLTRLPGALRVSAPVARRIIETNFPATHFLSAASAAAAMSDLMAAQIVGGSVYDGLVALAARESGVVLLRCDRRAIGTYAMLGVPFELF